MAHTAGLVNNSIHQTETTFKNYKAEDAAKYAAYRHAYPPKLIQLVIESHLASGGQNGHLLDIGCGPGNSTVQIAPSFRHVTGIDASPSMIEHARQSGCLTAAGEAATFEVGNSEEIDKLFEPNSIDLITVATAAHWFDMPRFYTAASKVLKPSGSIAMWCSSRYHADPKTTPNFESVRKLWDQLEYDIFRPYETKGNIIARDLYIDLGLPWTIDTSLQHPDTCSALNTYDESGSLRKYFNKDGVPDPSPEFAATNGFLKYTKVPLEAMAKTLATSSPVKRWREAHKEALEKKEIEDCVDYMLRMTRAEFAKAGKEGDERDWIEFGSSMVLILVKRKAA